MESNIDPQKFNEIIEKDCEEARRRTPNKIKIPKRDPRESTEQKGQSVVALGGRPGGPKGLSHPREPLKLFQDNLRIENVGFT